MSEACENCPNKDSIEQGARYIRQAKHDLELCRRQLEVFLEKKRIDVSKREVQQYIESNEQRVSTYSELFPSSESIGACTGPFERQNPSSTESICGAIVMHKVADEVHQDTPILNS